jgi:hypothetical protein
MENKKEELLEQLKYIKSKIYSEGFHYCFIHYSDFKEVEDEEFHKLRKMYVSLSQKLEEYINKKITELDTESLNL